MAGMLLGQATKYGTAFMKSAPNIKHSADASSGGRYGLYLVLGILIGCVFLLSYNIAKHDGWVSKTSGDAEYGWNITSCICSILSICSMGYLIVTSVG